ncbi:MAG: hypothetical protein U1F56_00615 [Rubrivivax sp.]
MFVGHVGAGLFFARRSAPQVNAGWFVSAALAQDLLLWVFLLAGLESGRIPAEARHGWEIAYTFPYSHGLLATAAWALAAGALGLALVRGAGRGAAALGLAAAVASHGLLDVLVHRPQLPLAGPGSTPLGLALWDHMPLALGLEAAVALVGVWAFVRAVPLPRARRIGLVALCLLLLLFTAGGLLAAPPPPSIASMAVSSLLVQAAVCAAVFWIGRRAR